MLSEMEELTADDDMDPIGSNQIVPVALAKPHFTSPLGHADTSDDAEQTAPPPVSAPQPPKMPHFAPISHQQSFGMRGRRISARTFVRGPSDQQLQRGLSTGERRATATAISRLMPLTLDEMGKMTHGELADRILHLQTDLQGLEHQLSSQQQQQQEEVVAPSLEHARSSMRVRRATHFGNGHTEDTDDDDDHPDHMSLNVSQEPQGLSRARLPKSTHELKKSRSEEEKFLNQYLVLDEIGRGVYGKVKLGYDPEHDSYVAIKVIKKPSGFGTGRSHAQQENFLREIVIMKKLRHKNIVSLIEVINDPKVQKVYIVMEYIDGCEVGRVDKNDRSCTKVEPILLAEYCVQLACGLAYFHSHQVVHRDIKPENILVQCNKKRVVFADFGVSQILPKSAKNKVVGKVHGTKLFMAPELFVEGEGNGPAVDVWALGVTIYALLVGKMPFESEAQICDPAFQAVDDLPEAKRRWGNILKRMLNRDVAKRPNSGELRGIFSQLLFDLKDDEELADSLLRLNSSNENSCSHSPQHHVSEGGEAAKNVGTSSAPQTLVPEGQQPLPSPPLHGSPGLGGRRPIDRLDAQELLRYALTVVETNTIGEMSTSNVLSLSTEDLSPKLMPAGSQLSTASSIAEDRDD